MTQCCSLLNVPSLPAVPIRSQFHRSMQENGDARSHHLLQRTSSFLSETSFSSTNSMSSGTFDNARSYYLSKAPLILEESRCIIAEALARQNNQRNSGCSLSLQLLSVDEKYPQMNQRSPLLFNFKILKIKESEKGMSWSRPGNVFVLSPKRTKLYDADHPSVLVCIAPMTQTKSDSNEGRGASKSSYISLLIFRRDDLNLSHNLDLDESNEINGGEMFQAIALTTLISQGKKMSNDGNKHYVNMYSNNY
jgi:hypothetical protein